MSLNTSEAVWHDIPDYEGLYQIHRESQQVRSLPRHVKWPMGVRKVRARTLASMKERGGIAFVTLCKNGTRSRISIHKLMMLTFADTTEEQLEGMVCRHRDGDLNNNDIDNLEWITRAELLKNNSNA